RRECAHRGNSRARSRRAEPAGSACVVAGVAAESDGELAGADVVARARRGDRSARLAGRAAAALAVRVALDDTEALRRGVRRHATGGVVAAAIRAAAGARLGAETALANGALVLALAVVRAGIADELAE